MHDQRTARTCTNDGQWCAYGNPTSKGRERASKRERERERASKRGREGERKWAREQERESVSAIEVRARESDRSALALLPRALSQQEIESA
eukprot:1039527-Pleurochrysis_carterae.AAC.1